MSNEPVTARVPNHPVPRPDLRSEIEDFLYDEADLLDRWELTAWFKLFAPGAVYIVPATDLPEGDPSEDLVLIHDDYFLLEQRVHSLLSRSAHAEYPPSRTRRMITNVKVQEVAANSFEVRANFLVSRMRSGRTDQFVGSYRHRLIVDDSDKLLFKERRAILDYERLDQGKLSIIL
jgi:p-cumate 2,3-dioxygenase beta subunit